MKNIILIILMSWILSIVPQDNSVFPPTAQTGNKIEDANTQYLPIIFNSIPTLNSFGVESVQFIPPGSLLSTRAKELGIGLMRLNDKISWRLLQPNRGEPINWALLSGFEAELRALRAMGITPIIIVDDYPVWATDNTVRLDGQSTSCGPLRDDRLTDFAAFFQALVTRYNTPEFNIHAWELGNEPDVDPNIVSPNNIFGCWGNVGDYYYGGERYGRMVITVGQAIKAIDPSAQVWLGGLLLDRTDSDLYPPTCGLPDCGHSERFFQGILQSGAAPYFDIVPYHAYQNYYKQRIDYDTNAGGGWKDLGGAYLGKARFLRSIMSQYGIDKPVAINETALSCPDNFSHCSPPGNDFYQMQADFLVRSYVRGFSANIYSYSWYTLDNTWRYSGLLNSENNPKPVYFAYQQLLIRLNATSYRGPYTYGAGIEAYAFNYRNQQIHVIWSRTDTGYTINLPKSEFVAAYTRNGASITPTSNGSDYQLQVTFEPIYLIRSH